MTKKHIMSEIYWHYTIENEFLGCQGKYGGKRDNVTLASLPILLYLMDVIIQLEHWVTENFFSFVFN